MKSALFSKLSLVPYLVVAGLSGCGDSGDTSNANQGQAVCPEPPGVSCPCPNGSTGFATCQAGQWGPCMCGGQPQGTGGFGNTPTSTGGQILGGPICGDGQITGGEQCDGQNHNQETCAKMTMGACQTGYLICSANCVFEYTGCDCTAAGGQGGSGASFGAGGTASLGGTTGAP